MLKKTVLVLITLLLLTQLVVIDNTKASLEYEIDDLEMRISVTNDFYSCGVPIILVMNISAPGQRTITIPVIDENSLTITIKHLSSDLVIIPSEYPTETTRLRRNEEFNLLSQ